MLLIAGPCLSISPMRAEYFSTRERAGNLPDFIPSCKSMIVISSSSKGWTSGAAGAPFEGLAVADVVSLADPNAGYSGVRLAAALPITVALRNERRLAANFVSP